MRTTTYSRSPVRLHLHPLETRDTPAGTVNAALAGGVLTLTGDDDANVIQLVQAGSTITVNGVGTAIDGGSTFNNVTSVKAVMKGGNDDVSIGPIDPFSLKGAADFDLGDGNNTLGLATAGKITLGRLTAKAGDGDDSIIVSGLAGSQVAGNVSLNLQAGDSRVDFANVGIGGSAGLRVQAADGNDIVNVVGMQLPRNAIISTGRGQLGASISGSDLGSLSLAATGMNPLASPGGIDLSLTATNITGAIRLKSQAGVLVNMSEISAARLSATGDRLGTVEVNVQGPVSLTTGGATLRGRRTELRVSPSPLITFDLAGDLVLNGSDSSFLQVDTGTLAARGVRVTTAPRAATNGQAHFLAIDAAVGIDRDIVISGGDSEIAIENSAVYAANASLSGSAVARIVQSGIDGTTLHLTGSLTTRAPQASVDIASGDLTVGGHLIVNGSTTSSVAAGPGTILDLGAVSIAAGAGEVTGRFEGAQLTIARDLTVSGQNSGPLSLAPFSTIFGDVTFTLGNDDDAVTINSNVDIRRNLTIDAGAGNNVLTLGTSAADFQLFGNLSVACGGGDDLLTVNRAAITGTSRISTGSGTDFLQLNGPTTFNGAVTIDLGAGDDTWNAANDPGTTAGLINFSGTVLARMGTGNDTLRLGLWVGAGGNPTTRVAFSDSIANGIDGGTGLNFYDDTAFQYVGTVAIVKFPPSTP